MTLLELQSCIDRCVEYIKKQNSDYDPEIHIYVGEKLYTLDGVGQFGVTLDVNLTAGELVHNFEDGPLLERIL